MNSICLALMMLLSVQTNNGGGRVSTVSAQDKAQKPEAAAVIERQKGATGEPGTGQNPPDQVQVNEEIELLKVQLAEQQRQIEQLRQELENHKNGADQPVSAQAKMMPAVMKVPPRGSDAQAEQMSNARVSNARESAPPASAISGASPAPADSAQDTTKEPSPLSFRIGSAYITPVGFMDFTFVGRSTATGSGIGTNFGSIPLNNTAQGHLSETRLSAQNSRFGVRVDAKVRNANILGYLESDFLGFVPTNAAVTSNSYSFRLRLYWADIRQGKFEVLGGQSWSLLTPGRKGISPLPGDLFYTQNIDTNYQAGLVWARIPQFRFVYHASNTVALGFSAENPEQYIGGSAGGGTVTLPSALVNAFNGVQLNNGGSTLSVPNLHPDMVAKIAFDPKVGKRDLHLEVGGVVRSFKLFNPNSMQAFTTTGGGGQVNINFELFKNLRIVTNNFYSDGGGRYIFGQAPDLVVRPDGSASLVHSLSTVSGFEWQARKNTQFSAYYGGVYIQRNIVIDTNGNLVGYGYIGSGNGQNRSIQEGTFGFTHTFWRDPKYGALQFMGQYSYLTRNPWFVATGQPDAARANIYFLNLRYVLPGSAPAKVE